MLRRALQARGVARGPLDALVVPLVDVLQLRAEDAGVEVVEPAVEAEAVDVALVRAVVAQLADRRVDVGVVGDERAAVAERAEVLLDDEADGGGVAQFADPEAVAGASIAWALSSITRSLCLSAIFLIAGMSAHWP